MAKARTIWYNMRWIYIQSARAANPAQKEDRVYENQSLIRLPVVRNGKAATVGYAPETWKQWEENK